MTNELCNLVRHFIELHYRDQESGSTLFKRLSEQRKQTGKTDSRLYLPSPPLGFEHVWSWFWQLDHGRPLLADGRLAKICHDHIAAYCALTDTVMREHEVAMILAMDRARLDKGQEIEAANEHARNNSTSERPLTPALFNALFSNGKDQR